MWVGTPCCSPFPGTHTLKLKQNQELTPTKQLTPKFFLKKLKFYKEVINQENFYSKIRKNLGSKQPFLHQGICNRIIMSPKIKASQTFLKVTSFKFKTIKYLIYIVGVPFNLQFHCQYFSFCN